MATESTIDTSSTYTVDYTTEDVVNAWQTKRLRMIRIEPGDPAVRQALAGLQQDPVVTALASNAVLQPVGSADLDGAIAVISQALLGVAIALLPAADASPELPPVIIGNMTLGWGGLAPRTAHHRTAGMGITLARAWQGQGYGAEAIDWMLDWAFAHAGLHSVSLSAADFNQRAVRVYQKLGFRVEGRYKERIYFNRAWHDEIAFGITEHEWAALRGKK
ncbi:GNAT family acetyltransferase, putative [Cordyceps militaris CM01]|uniref:GNAT family acetyltransferase, putative n=1 Tax=Cordyceps militaris (strain CM01) TaxID=983644 RepID=G3JMC0_CORMM|nr:GNAT family acetyltransferase, putative [Cordyceps militaris CM01]EGX90008.1 GNAT family acetyltransferase, putative [Cordyceps militaris CM01]